MLRRLRHERRRQVAAAASSGGIARQRTSMRLPTLRPSLEGRSGSGGACCSSTAAHGSAAAAPWSPWPAADMMTSPQRASRCTMAHG